MRDAFRRILARYGQAVTLRIGDLDWEGLAFLRPFPSPQSTDGDILPTKIGLSKPKRYLYLGEPQLDLSHSAQALLFCEGRRFFVVSAEAVRIGRRLSHWRAILQEEEGAT